MYKVSVIVPVYNVEAYIEQCVRSLMEQTLDCIEYIFVNDATPDDSISVLKRVLDDYPERKACVKILKHEVNKGLPSARHTGLMASSGEYVIHCDSDDWVDKDMYNQLYQFAKKDNLDIAFCDYYNVSVGGEITVRSCASCTSPDIIEDAFMRHLPFSIWTKLIKRSIATDPRIKKAAGCCGEDLSTSVQAFLLCTSVGHVGIPLYYYRRLTTSITGQNDIQSVVRKQNEFVKNFEQVVQAISNANKSYQYTDCIEHYSLHVKNGFLPALVFGYPTKCWRNCCKEINRRVLISPLFTLKEKILFIITFLGLYPKFRRIMP